MINYFFTSDIHFNHSAVLGYCNRPYKDVFEMNEQLIHNWNSIVKGNDIVYVLGDSCFGNTKTNIECFQRLKGKRILIKGNHDNFGEKKAKETYGFAEVHNMIRQKINNIPLTMCHFPMHAWNKSHKGELHIHGHIHNKPISFMWNRYNVGVDVNDYKPVSFEELMCIFKQRKMLYDEYLGVI